MSSENISVDKHQSEGQGASTSDCEHATSPTSSLPGTDVKASASEAEPVLDQLTSSDTSTSNRQTGEESGAGTSAPDVPRESEASSPPIDAASEGCSGARQDLALSDNRLAAEECEDDNLQNAPALPDEIRPAESAASRDESRRTPGADQAAAVSVATQPAATRFNSIVEGRGTSKTGGSSGQSRLSTSGIDGSNESRMSGSETAIPSITLNGKSQPVDLKQVALILNRQQHRNSESGRMPSPNSNEEEEEDEGDEEGGAHDTITSLAGVKVLQKYRKQIRGHGGRRGSQDSTNRLEHLFKDEPLLEEEEKFVSGDDEAGEDMHHLEDEHLEEDVFVPPDGGYGWFVTLGAFICLFWTAGWVKSYGVVFAQIIKLYPDNVSMASWIPATMTTTSLAMSPIASALCQRLNCRVVTSVGAMLCFIGITLSAFMPSLEYMFFTLGILSGAGIGLSTTPGIILTARYFNKKRSRANALCLSGTAAGSFTLPMLMQFLFETYGFRGTLLIMGGCVLNVCVSAALFRPLAVHVVIVRNKAKKALIKQTALEAKSKENCLPRYPAESDQKNITDQQSLPLISTEADLSRVENSVVLYSEASPPRYEDTEDWPSVNSHLSSSYPQTNSFMRQNSEDMMTPLEKLKSSQNSLDTISINSYRSCDKYHDTESQMSGSDLQSERDYRSQSHKDHRNMKKQISTQSENWNKSSSMFYFDEHKRSQSTSSKSLSLRELAFHQIGSHLNIYKSKILGQSQDGGHGEEGGHPPVTQATPSSTATKSTGRRSSFLFSCEDIMVDSTAILKDSRHPSHTHLASGEIHRVVTLTRAQSSVGSASQASTRTSLRQRRPRFISESSGASRGVSRNSSFCSTAWKHDRVSMIGSSELLSDSTITTPARKFMVSPAVLDSHDKFAEEDEDKSECGEDGEAEAAQVPDQKVEVKKPKTNPAVLCCQSIQKYIDFRLCLNPVFLILAGSVMTMAIGMPHCLFFLPTYAQSLGISASDAGFLLSLSAISDLVGRLAFGFLLDLNLFPKYMGYSAMILVSGLSALLLPSMTNFSQITLCMSFFGVGTGSWFLMVPLLLAEYLGVEQIGSSYGLVRLFQSVTNLFGPIVAGHIYASTGQLAYSFYMMGSCMCMGSVLVLFLPLAIRSKKTVKD